jgi:hypothetical protein
MKMGNFGFSSANSINFVNFLKYRQNSDMKKREKKPLLHTLLAGKQASILLQAARSLYQKSGLVARPRDYGERGCSSSRGQGILTTRLISCCPAQQRTVNLLQVLYV